MIPPIARTVVVIDDDESICRAVGRLLRSAGLCARTFGSAEEFLQAGRPSTPSCLVLDVHLPGLSGPQLWARLQAEGRAAPAVYISADSDDRLREAAMGAGAVAFLPKPFDDRALLDAVARACRADSPDGPGPASQSPTSDR
jgi:FixJ family two-component response regulator